MVACEPVRGGRPSCAPVALSSDDAKGQGSLASTGLKCLQRTTDISVKLVVVIERAENEFLYAFEWEEGLNILSDWVFL